MRTSTPKVHHLETDLMAGDATSAYLMLAQTLPSADDGDGDATYALFHPLLSISVPVPTDDSLPAPSPKFLLDTGASTTFVDPKLAARLGWDVKKGMVRMQVRLGMRDSSAPVPPTAMNSVSATATLSNADTHTTQLPTCAAAESASLTDVLRCLQAEFCNRP
ncbi:hypothetical protein C364_05296 [Cryptococcus neoformans Bt63]|nr:hypothetical protein C364_05296 [Cryptococcus neoformans var. grubii Bt63]